MCPTVDSFEGYRPREVFQAPQRGGDPTACPLKCGLSAPLTLLSLHYKVSETSHGLTRALQQKIESASVYVLPEEA